MFVEQENIVCTLKWPSVIAKNGKKIFILRRKKFGGLGKTTTTSHQQTLLINQSRILVLTRRDCEVGSKWISILTGSISGRHESGVNNEWIATRRRF